MKSHPWFDGFQWDDLLNKRIIAPFKPKKGDNFDKKYCDAPEKLDNETKVRYEKILNDTVMMQQAFKDFLPFGELNDRNLSRKALVSRESGKDFPVVAKLKAVTKTVETKSNKIRKIVRSTSNNIQPSYAAYASPALAKSTSGTTFGTRKSNRSTSSYGVNYNINP